MNSNFIGIPTLQQWKSYSSVTGRRLAYTRAVDKVFEEFENLRHNNPSDNSLIIGLLRIAIECCKWLEAKAQSKSSQRRPAIQRLLHNAIDEAIRLKPGLESLRAKLPGPPNLILSAIKDMPAKILWTQQKDVVMQRLAPFA